MVTKKLADLEKVIEKWLNDSCEDDETKDVTLGEDVYYYYPNLTKDMAKAASIVFDASFKSQSNLEDCRDE